MRYDAGSPQQLEKIEFGFYLTGQFFRGINLPTGLENSAWVFKTKEFANYEVIVYRPPL